MSSTWHPAPDSLAGVLAGTWVVHAAREFDLSARVLPDGATYMVLQRDRSVLRTCEDGEKPWGAMCVSGPRTGPLDITLSADGRMLIVQLLPAGAMQAIGVPMSSLANTFEPLDAVVGSVPQSVRDCVLGDADDLSCVRAMERWLLERVRARRTVCEVTDEAVREVGRRGGSIRVEELAGHVDLSRRHLGRIMQERIGFSPKLFARITRFDHAVRAGRQVPLVPWARIAVDAGYADQAHMAREFAALGGILPSELRGAGADTIW